MIRIAKNTRLTTEEIIEKAVCCISFEGAGGYVTVSVADQEGRRMVDVESREFEYQTKGFMNTL
jgi:hypothetical protein